MVDNIEMRCNQINFNSLEIILTNNKYAANRRTTLKWCSASAISLIAKLLWWKFWFPIDVTLVVLVLGSLYVLSNLIEYEKILVVDQYAISVTKGYSFGRNKYFFIGFNHVHDVVISEVILNLKVVYMLMVQTKEPKFKGTPNISLLTLMPNIAILELIYNEIQRAMSECSK